MARTSRDTAILGAGPAGLAAALALSSRGGARIITPGLPAATDVPRVDMVPAAFVAFLLELGIHPGQIGVHDLHDVRRIAWSDAVPETVRGSAVAHVERPALELALLAALERMSGFKIVPSPTTHPADPGERVIDATGRRAVSATRTTGLAKPWIARVFSRYGVFDKADQAFRLAALPAGYAYRLASPRLLAIGVVVSKAAGGMTPKDIEKYVHAAGAGWVLKGLGSLEFNPGRKRRRRFCSVERRPRRAAESGRRVTGAGFVIGAGIVLRHFRRRLARSKFRPCRPVA